MIGVLKPWLVFGIVATVITAILGVGSVLWTLGLRPKRWAKREREPLQDGLDEEGHPLDPFAIQHHLKKLERKRFAALLVIFCVLLLFAALGTFVYYINNRTSENISSSNVDVRSLNRPFSPLQSFLFVDSNLLLFFSSLRFSALRLPPSSRAPTRTSPTS